MDSRDDTREAKRASSAAAGDVDLISGLDEDVLLRILELVGDTRDAMRTCVLSRRWLGLWKRIPGLRFASGWPPPAAAAASSAFGAAAERMAAMERMYVSLVNDILAERCADPEELDYYHVSSIQEVYAKITCFSPPAVSMVPGLACHRYAALQLSALRQFVSGVNGILARRRTQSDCAIESLAISYYAATNTMSFGRTPGNLEQLAPAFVDAAQGWIQYAFRRHGLKSLVIDLHGLRHSVFLAWNDQEKEQATSKTCPSVLLDELPDPPPAMMETMHLSFGGASVRLPAANAMKFASLVDLSLEKMIITNGGARRLLTCLVSPANCPHLQKLRLDQLRLPDEDPNFKGEEMKLESSVLSELWIDGVNLRTSLELTAPGLRIFHINSCDVEKLTISAPRLEELAFFPRGHPPRCLVVADGELPCVRSLKICVRAYQYHTCNLNSSWAAVLTAENDINIRLLDQCISVTSLDVTLLGHLTSDMDEDMIKGMVPRLPQVTSLTVNVSADISDRHNFGTSVARILTQFTNLRNLRVHLRRLFNNIQPRISKLYPDYCVSMAHLKRVELTGLSATELSFVKAMLACSQGLSMMTLSFTAECWKQEHKMAAYKQMLHDEGMKTSHSGGFTLTCRKQLTHA